jgi:osmotically-inducible protein OsmY
MRARAPPRTITSSGVEGRSAMSEDRSIQAEVMRELERDPELDPAHIGVSVRNAGVTLSGWVSSRSERVHVLRAAERVYGVRAIADELTLDLPTRPVDDTLIAESIAHMLRWRDEIPDTVEAEVAHGLVTLTGMAEWPFQVEEARRVVKGVTGVRGVTSTITVRHAGAE